MSMDKNSANAKIAWETKQAVEAAFAGGAPKAGTIGRHRGVKSAYQVAAKALGVSERCLRDRVAANGLLARHKLKINWTKPGSEKMPEEDVIAEVDLTAERMRQASADELGKLRAQVKSFHREVLTEDVIREKMFGLAAEPLRPPSWSIQRTTEGKSQEAVILALSDLHWGEVINLDSMGGRNSFNMDIAHKRLYRYFSHACELGTKHWVGPPPAIIYLWLGGDMISGEIHEELAKTNDLLAIRR